MIGGLETAAPRIEDLASCLSQIQTLSCFGQHLLETNIIRCSLPKRDLTKWIRIPPAMAGAWADAGTTDHQKQNMRTDTGRASGHNSVAIRGFSVVGEYADGHLLVGRPPTDMQTGTTKCIAAPAFMHNNQYGTVWSVTHWGKGPRTLHQQRCPRHSLFKGD